MFKLSPICFTLTNQATFYAGAQQCIIHHNAIKSEKKSSLYSKAVFADVTQTESQIFIKLLNCYFTFSIYVVTGRGVKDFVTNAKVLRKCVATGEGVSKNDLCHHL